MALYSASVEYGLHCLLNLVGRPSNDIASTAELAEFQGISATFVAKLLTRLKAQGLVTATEGIGGGYRLARTPEQISVLDVVLALEGDKPLFQCKDIRRQCAVFGQSPPRWATKGLCSIHAIMVEAEEAMKQTLATHTLADLAQRFADKAPQTFFLDADAWFRTRRATQPALAKRTTKKLLRKAP
jgi:Rrf2 family protein